MTSRRVLLLIPLGSLIWIITGFAFRRSLTDWLLLRVPGNELVLGTTILILYTLAVAAAANPLAGARLETLTKSSKELSSLLDNLPVGVYRITPDSKVLYCNPQFTKTLGYDTPQQMRGFNLDAVYTNKSDRQIHLERLKEAPAFAEFEIRTKDGGSVWVREYPRATLKVDGTVDYIDGVCVETHGIDAILREASEHKRLQSMRDNFIVSVTHELRTPLVSIRGYLDHILARENSLPPSIKSQLEVVGRNADRLLELTNDLLNFDSLQGGKQKVKLEKFDIREVLTWCIEEIQPLLQEKKQLVRLDGPDKPVFVVGDRLRLSQVVLNLLTNANKFTPNNERLTVRVEEAEASATVYVTDTGIGISKDDLGRVFEPFAPIRKPTYFKGSGLGLSLAKKLIEAQGGKIWATSQGMGLGTTFAFTLPKTREEIIRIHG